MRADRRRLVWIGAALLTAAVVWLWRCAEAPELRVPNAAPGPAPKPAPPRPAVPAVVPAADLALLTQDLQDPVRVAVSLERYKAANRYAPTTIPLQPGMLDALDPERRFATDVPAPWIRNLYTKPSHRVYYRLETDKIRYVAPEPIEIKLAVFRGDQQRTPAEVEVDVVAIRRIDPAGHLVGHAETTLARLGTGTYAGTYTPLRRGGASHDVVLQLDVTWKLADGTGKPVQDRVLVQYTPAPPASFTGRFTDRVEGGSLRIDVEVESAGRGRAQISANLFGAGGETPVATAIARPLLAPGRSWVTLEFYGLALNDRGVPGPFVLKTLRGFFPSSTSGGRGGEMARFAGSHTTAAYPLSAFTTREWDSPEKQAAIATYETELARLRRAPAL